jgi:hypothetical protein
MLSAPIARAAIDPAQAAFIFKQARAICSRDAGALWGQTLCGPMLLVDPDDLTVVANVADAGGLLTRSGAVFVGHLPPSVTVSDTTVLWSGTRWCELIWPWPMRLDPDMREVTLAHEMFHRIQEDLHIERLDGDNRHLDTLDGRYLMLLEWRALAAALQAKTPENGRIAIADAILFRRQRYRIFPDAEANETALESNEGVAEYTGVRLGLTTPEARTLYAIRDLSAYTEVPSLVRSFAYATGPAYGLLMDEVSPAWRSDFAGHQLAQGFDRRLGAALHLAPSDFDQLKVREAVYDGDGALLAHEIERDQARQARLAEYQARLVDGAVLTLPLAKSNFEFQPQSLVPLGDQGTVYPTMRLTDVWGTLTMKSGGVLIRKQAKIATLSAIGFDGVSGKGPGFELVLKPGWTMVPGPRKGDLALQRIEKVVPQ